MKERLTVSDPLNGLTPASGQLPTQQFFGELEALSMAEFYHNEDQIQQQMGKHAPFESFLYELIDHQDSKHFCDSLLPMPALGRANCSEFHEGILK